MSSTRHAVAGPAAWTGAEMSRRTDWAVALAPVHVDELLAATAAVAHLALDQIGRDNFPLPTLGAEAASIVDELVRGRGFVLLRGVPVHGLDEATLERLYWGLGCHLGIGIPQNAAGDMLVHVRDQGLDFANPEVRGYQTSAALDYHSDSSDIVGLLCVRPAREGGVSTIVSAAAVHNEALRRRPDLLDELCGTWWWDRRQKDVASSFFQRRIFALVGGDLVSYYGRAHIESATRGEHVPQLTPRQIEALDLLDELANDPALRLDMPFRPGDVQLLNNYKIWHARTDYVDFPEPERKRVLYRLWLRLRDELELPDDFAVGGITDRSGAFS
jgi:hypothetical protein